MAIKAEQRVRLLSRNDLSLNGRFPEVVEALEARRGDRPRARRRGRGVRRRATSFARLQQRGERPDVGLLLRVRPPVPGGARRHRAAAARPQVAAAPRGRVPRPAAAHPAPQPRRRGAVPRGVPQGLGGADRQARRLAVRARALARLAQVQVLGRAGARDRRLHRAARQPHRPRRAAARLLRGRAAALRRQGRHRLHARGRCASWRRSWSRCAGTTRRSPTRSASGP